MKRGQVAILGLVLALVLFIAVGLPVVYDVISSTNTSGRITGTTATIVNLLPLGMAIGALALVFLTISGRFGR